MYPHLRTAANNFTFGMLEAMAASLAGLVLALNTCPGSREPAVAGMWRATSVCRLQMRVPSSVFALVYVFLSGLT